MKKLIVALLLAPLAALAQSNEGTPTQPRKDAGANIPIPAGATIIMRLPGGSGTPGFSGFEPATHMGEGIYHAPQYLPQFPTAATLWPRVIDVLCEKQTNNSYVCDGYNWIPAFGRGEYLYIRPQVKAQPVAPRVVEKIITVPAPGPERIILKEVPIKKKAE